LQGVSHYAKLVWRLIWIGALVGEPTTPLATTVMLSPVASVLPPVAGRWAGDELTPTAFKPVTGTPVFWMLETNDPPAQEHMHDTILAEAHCIIDLAPRTS
jgi:hypothetical protein